MLTEAEYAALLNAVPSFERRWAAHQADDRRYVERFPEEARTERQTAIEFLSQLAYHVGGQVGRGEHPEELAWLFAALERIYARADEDLWSQLTLGFLENVIYAAEHAGGSAAGIGAHTAGVRTAHAWRAAYEYIHPPDEEP